MTARHITVNGGTREQRVETTTILDDQVQNDLLMVICIIVQETGAKSSKAMHTLYGMEKTDPSIRLTPRSHVRIH